MAPLETIRANCRGGGFSMAPLESIRATNRGGGFSMAPLETIEAIVIPQLSSHNSQCWAWAPNAANVRC